MDRRTFGRTVAGGFVAAVVGPRVAPITYEVMGPSTFPLREFSATFDVSWAAIAHQQHRAYAALQASLDESLRQFLNEYLHGVR